MTERMISVLVPERGRPDELQRLIDSLWETAVDHEFEILVAIDKDDPAWVGRPEPTGCRVFSWPRPPTLGEKLNMLAAEAKGGLLWFIANDYVMDTPGWPDRIRAAAAKLPNGVGVAYTPDGLHPDHTAFWMMTRSMYEGVGIFAPPWFPYWFVDSWWDEVGILTGIKVMIEADVHAPEGRGKSHALIDLPFWSRFFEETRPLRVRDSVMLMEAAYGREGAQMKLGLQQLAERQRFCAQRTAHLHTEAFQKRWSGRSDSPPSPAYPEVKATAEQLLQDIQAQKPRAPRVAICVPSGRAWEAATATSVAALTAMSARNGIDIAILNIQTSMISHGRNATVHVALEEGCDWLLWIDSDMKFPPDALLRLLRHGKDVVGATYNRRVAPYQTLGRFVGERPAEMHDGLHEAEFLPSGMLLVKASVYRSMAYPYYAEAYEWPGADGLEKFRSMMLDWCGVVPPPDVLDSLAETEFGAWARENFKALDIDDGSMMLSEDIFWCRKTRRRGGRIWCDLALTYEMVHLGVQEVTTLKPEATLLDAAD